MFLVTGASGNVGGELVRALAGAGEKVRALTRSDRPPSLPPGVEAVAGDLNEPAGLGAAMAGARGMFLLPGYRNAPDLLEQARRAGVERVVLLSGGSAGSRDTSNAITRYMMEAESAVRDSGLRATILRPASFMSNALRWLPQLRAGDVVRGPFATVRTAIVDPYDIAAVAAAALRGDGPDGRILWPTGPDSLLPAEQVAILGSALGRNLRFDAQPNDEAYAEMTTTTPVEYVDAFFDFYVAGSLDESQARPTVREITGREPRTFEQWAVAHAAAFVE